MDPEHLLLDGLGHRLVPLLVSSQATVTSGAAVDLTASAVMS